MDGARASLPGSSFPLVDLSPGAAAGRASRDALVRSGEIAVPIWRALDRAADNAAELLASRADDVTHESGNAQLASAVVAVRRLVRRTSDGPRPSLPIVGRELLDLLRSEFLRQLVMEASSIDGRQLIRVLLAFDHLAARSMPAAAARDDGPAVAGGFDAVVEIAHDMRSPLSSILFLVEALRTARSGPVTSAQERQLGLIYGAALGLSTLASDLIDLVRGGDSLVDGQPAPFSVAEIMLGVRHIVTPIAEEKGLTLEFVLPTVDGRIGYGGALGRVLLNLTTNALKYTDNGYVRIGCTELSGTRLTFWVADTGSGIPKPVLRSLFSPFRRTAGRMRFSNSGLGLAICRSLLGAMESTLQVESNAGVGTRFCFELELPPAADG
jgi:signal transduction histidine kinase